MLESWTEVYDRTWEGRGVSAFGLRPSYRRCLYDHLVSAQESRHEKLRREAAARRTYLRMYIRWWHREYCRGSGDCSS